MAAIFDGGSPEVTGLTWKSVGKYKWYSTVQNRSAGLTVNTSPCSSSAAGLSCNLKDWHTVATPANFRTLCSILRTKSSMVFGSVASTGQCSRSRSRSRPPWRLLKRAHTAEVISFIFASHSEDFVFDLFFGGFRFVALTSTVTSSTGEINGLGYATNIVDRSWSIIH